MNAQDRNPGHNPSPALIPVPTVITVLVALVVLDVLAWAFDWPFLGFLLAATIVWGLLFGVGTILAFRVARKAGEWPPRDRRDA